MMRIHNGFEWGFLPIIWQQGEKKIAIISFVKSNSPHTYHMSKFVFYSIILQFSSKSKPINIYNKKIKIKNESYMYFLSHFFASYLHPPTCNIAMFPLLFSFLPNNYVTHIPSLLNLISYLQDQYNSATTNRENLTISLRGKYMFH